MKILQVITSLNIGGAEKLIVDIVPILMKRGHDVDVLIFNKKDTSLKKKLQESGVKIYSLGNSFYNPFFILKLIPFLSAYDIVHTHNTACQYFVALAKLFSFSSCKTVTTEHSTMNRRRDIWWFRFFDTWMYKQYAKIISISYKSTENLVKYIGQKDRIITILNGIDINFFCNSKAINKKLIGETPDAAIILTMVAGFREEKDQDTIIKTMKLLPENYYLWLVGDGERKSSCIDLAKKFQVENRIVFTGIREDVACVLKASDVIIMSSHYEGLSLSSIEGMSVGKPFVASDVDGLHEIVDGAGVLFEKGNTKALATCIQQLIEDKKYCDSVAAKCLERASGYDIQKMVDAYEKLYIELI